jgi:hypothetical protein
LVDLPQLDYEKLEGKNHILSIYLSAEVSLVSGTDFIGYMRKIKVEKCQYKNRKTKIKSAKHYSPKEQILLKVDLERNLLLDVVMESIR